MPRVKPLDRSSKKWIRQSQAATEEYKLGIQNPKTDWADATADAEENYKAGVIKAANDGQFAKGVRKAGSGKWLKGALEKGVTRWPEGIRVSETAWKEGFAPFAQTIENTTLPPKGPKNSPQNYQRSQQMGEALHAKKIELSS